MRILVSLIVMAMISAMAYAADTASTSSAAAPLKSASMTPPPKGLKGDAPATKGKLPSADEAPKAPASGSIPPSRLPQ